MRDFVKKLDSEGCLRTVEREVDPQHELAAVTKAAQAAGDDAVLFDRVRGSNMPVVTNLYGSNARLRELIGAGENSFCQAWSQMLDASRQRSTAATTPGEPPADLVTGSLSDLPLITYHARDAGPYFTSAVYLAKDPETGIPNLSFHRSMYVSDEELRVRLGSSHDLARYQASAERADQPLEAALLIGVSPEVFLAACASVPADWNELELAAGIADRPIETYRGRSVDLDIPASTEIVIEGQFVPNERRNEGPFGEFLGYYVPAGDNHVFEVREVYWRKDPIFHSLLCGSPEDRLILEAVNAAKTFRHLNAQLPGIVDVSCSPAFMNTTIKIRQQYEGHARQVLMAAFAADLDYNKACFVVDEDIDISDMNEVIWAFVTRGRVDKRVLVIEDVPGFYRDEHKDHWGRIGIDATMPFERQAEFERKTIPGDEEIKLDDYF